MQTACTEQTRHGEDVTVTLITPEPAEAAIGERPRLLINTLDLLCHEEAGTLEKTAGMFVADMESVLLECAQSPAEAEQLASQLEAWAAAVRAKFSPQAQ